MVYDAGVDSGEFFKSGNQETNPQKPVTRKQCGKTFCRKGKSHGRELKSKKCRFPKAAAVLKIRKQ